MSRFFQLSLLALVTAFCACNGGTQTPSNVPGAEGGPGGPAVVADGDQTHDVSPVAEPGPLVVHVRWKNPGANVATAARLMRLPPAFINANTRVAVQELIHELLGDRVDAKAFAEAVDIDGSWDAVVVADTSRGGPVPEPLAAISFGLSSLARARDAVRARPHKLLDGVWRVGPPPEPWEGVCVIAASAGKTPGRLVCAEGEREIVRIAPYVARNVPVIPDAASDVHGEVNLRPLLDKYGRQWATQARGLPVLVEEFKTGIPKFDDALIDAATALAAEAGELIRDADKLVVDASLNETEGASITGKLTFAGNRSWLVQAMLQGAKDAGPAPEMFWHLPASSESATYARSIDPTHYEKVLETGRRLVEGLLEKEKIASAADRKAIAKLLRLPFKKGAATVAASGHFPGGSKPPGNMVEDLVNATVGWQLFGIEDSPAAMKSYLDDMLNAYNRAGLQSFLKKELGSDAKHLPMAKKTAAPPGLGGGSTAFEIRVPNIDDPSAIMAAPPRGAAPKPKTVDVTVHVVLMPDGQRTWVGIAGDKAALGKLMATLKGPKPGADSLASKGGLDAFKNGKHTSGALTTLDGLLGSVKPMLGMAAGIPGGGASRELQQIQQALERMPNKGASPIVMFGDVAPGAKPAVTFQARIPRESLVDMGFLVTQAMQIASQP